MERPDDLVLRPLVEDLQARRAQIELGGGEEKIEKQHERGKLTARERIALLSTRARSSSSASTGGRTPAAGDGRAEPPADAVVTGFGKVDGRMVRVRRVRLHREGGSIGQTGEEKVTRLRQMALRGRCRCVVHRLGRRAHPGGRRADSLFAGSGAPVPRAGAS